MPRPVRPSAQRAEDRAAERILNGKRERRLSLRVHPDTLASMNLEAAKAKKKGKRFVLDALAAAGVELHPDDATGDGEL
jgi:hypothetical protein